MWTEVKPKTQELKTYVQHVKDGAAHYMLNYTEGKAESFVTEKGGNLYWYEDNNYKIALTMYQEASGHVKVANCLVSEKQEGKGDHREVVKIALRKIREYMDAKGATYAYSITPATPFNPFQDKFHDVIDEMVWERSKVFVKEGNYWKGHCHRDPLRHNEDELWVHK